MIPGGNETNINGDPVDVLVTLRFKKELAAAAVPFMLQMIADVRESLLVSGEPANPALDEWEQKFRAIAQVFGVDPEPDEE
jgi:hypothetical protein